MLLDRAERFYQAACRATSIWGCERVSGGLTASRVESNICKLEAEFERFQRLAEACQQRSERALTAIERLDSAEYRVVLTLRYFGRQSWQQIADGMHKSREAVIKLHGRALQKLEL